MKQTIYTFIVISCLTISVTFTANAQDGSLDTTFNHDGKVNTIIGTGARGAGMAIQGDGKIVVAGNYSGGRDTGGVALVRYNIDGSLDNTFGLNGIVTTNNDTCSSNSMTIQDDGKIVVVGIFDDRYAVLRYNSNGSLDTTFGSGGLVTTKLTGNDYAITVAIQSDGKIVVGGYAASNFGVVRYNIDGSLDSTFGNSGVLILTTYSSAVNSIAIQSDGKIVLAGYAYYNVTYSNFYLARCHSNGSLDSTFGFTGQVITHFGSNTEGASANSVKILSDGKILAGGWMGDGYTSNFALERFNSDGSLDNTFNSNGLASVSINGGIGSIAIQSDDKIIAAGGSSNGSNNDFAVARFNSDGSLDSTFSSDGWVLTDFSGGDDNAFSVAIQTDGKIVAAGYTEASPGPKEYFAVARYNNSSTVGIVENKFVENSINIFPNPATNQLSIHTSSFHNEAVIVTVMNMLGQNASPPAPLQRRGESATIDVSGLSAGMYFLEMKTESGSVVKRFVKE